MARQRWSKEKVIERIQMRAKEGLPLNSDAIVHEDEPLMGAARRYCETWVNALKEAGFDPDDHRKVPERTKRWDKATVIAGIKDLATQGVKLNAHSVKRVDAKLVAAGTTHFGSWQKAIEAAGFDYEAVRKTARWSKDDVIKSIQTAHKANADLSDNTAHALNPGLYGAALHYFGSWASAVEQAGIDYDLVRRTVVWSKEKILDALAQGRISQELKFAAIKEFGSLEEARRLAGLADEMSATTINKIKERRVELGLSQEDLAKRVGCTHAWIGYLERRDLEDFKLSWALKIAKALETTVDNLFELSI